MPFVEQNQFQTCLAEAHVRDHLVYFYRDTHPLTHWILDFAAPALRSQQGVLLIARRDRLDRLRDALGARGISVEKARHSGQLVVLEAEEALHEFTLGEQAYWARFESCIGSAVAALAHRFDKVRAYGELVDILWTRGQRQAALEVEQFWNRMSISYPFCLFCAYALDGFERHEAKSMDSIRSLHSHAFADNSPCAPPFLR